MSSPESTPRAPGRDAFLDAVRTLALVRVVLWHTYGAPFLTYVVAAVPTMVFVTGSLLAQSLDRRPWRTVLLDRARRILLPLWAFGTVAFAAMSVALHVDPGPHTAVRWRSIVFWILPLGDPKGSAWEGGWMSQPLWYVRAMFWLLLLSPALRAAQRRIGLRLLALPLAALVVLEVLQRRGASFTAAPDLLWQLGDLALYSAFLVAGFAHRDGRFDRLDAATWRVGALVAGGVATAWVLTQPVPLGVVNNSHPAHLLVGTAWLCLLFSCRAPIERLAQAPRLGRAIDAFARRSMTVYLWHSTAIIVTFQLLDRRDLPGAVHVAAMLAGTVAITACFVLLAGWIEDVAARRTPTLWPLPPAQPARSTRSTRSVTASRAPRPALHRAVGGPALAGLVLLVFAAGTAQVRAARTEDGTDRPVAAASTRRPPVPSQAPPKPVFTRAATASTDATAASGAEGATLEASRVARPRLEVTVTPPVDRATAAVLQGVLDEWRARNGVPGVSVGVVLPGIGEWYGASGADADTGRAVSTDDRFDLASITKTFTAALVTQLAAEGRIDLDAPVPPLARVPTFPLDAGITVRNLLEHRTGIMPYRDTPTFAADPIGSSTPEAALAAALREPLLFLPDERSAYSSTNYLVLGFLLEQVTGETYDELLRTRLLEPLGLDHLEHLAPEPLLPNFATSGIVSDLSSVLRWTLALLRDGQVVDAQARADMHRIDPETGLGPAVMGYCPCSIDADGVARYRWIGHSGSDTQISYSELDDVAVAVHVTDSLWSEGRGGAIAELLEILRVRILELAPPAVLGVVATEDGQ